jgi:hypothetical protein
MREIIIPTGTAHIDTAKLLPRFSGLTENKAVAVIQVLLSAYLSTSKFISD